MYLCMYVCMHAWMYVCMHACMDICLSVCLSECMHVCVYIHIYTYIWIQYTYAESSGLDARGICVWLYKYKQGLPEMGRTSKSSKTIHRISYMYAIHILRYLHIYANIYKYKRCIHM